MHIESRQCLWEVLYKYIVEKSRTTLVRISWAPTVVGGPLTCTGTVSCRSTAVSKELYNGEELSVGGGEQWAKIQWSGEQWTVRGPVH